ncbi:MAG: hypothetical protein QW228_07460 [Candidatus Aenigmatarchaeota archaeon]
MKIVLVPGLVKFTVGTELAKTFDEECKVIWLSNTVITNYADKKQVEFVRREIRDNFEKVKKMMKGNTEVYVILSGSNFNVSEVISMLEQEGIEYKRLIYEKKIEKYVVVE